MSHLALRTLAPLIFILAAVYPVHAATNGMDMSMDDGMTLATGTMMTTLHFTPFTDTLWFTGWVPQSKGALAGACIGLFIFAILDRWIAAVRRLMEAHWHEEGRRVLRAAERASDDKTRRRRLSAPPFKFAHDAMRGAIHALQAALGFAFMLAVMTFQASFIISLVLGLGVGEMLFGRYAGMGAGTH